MKPHIQIHTDKPEELLEFLAEIQRNFPDFEASRYLRSAQTRLVETEHQGFNSYETFAIGILIDSDRDLLAKWLNTAEFCWSARRRNLIADDRGKTFSEEEAAELDLADLLKEHFDTQSPEIPSPWNELCNAGLSRVDWLDLAHHYIAKVKEGVSV